MYLHMCDPGHILSWTPVPAGGGMCTAPKITNTFIDEVYYY